MATRKATKQKTKRKPSKWTNAFIALVEVNGWPKPEQEVLFHKAGFIYQKRRMWRFDMAWPDLMLAVELDGMVFRPNSGHTSALGLSSDRVKDAVAQLMGWTVIRFTEVHFRQKDVEPIMEAAFDYCRKQQTTEVTA